VAALVTFRPIVKTLVCQQFSVTSFFHGILDIHGSYILAMRCSILVAWQRKVFTTNQNFTFNFLLRTAVKSFVIPFYVFDRVLAAIVQIPV